MEPGLPRPVLTPGPSIVATSQVNVSRNPRFSVPFPSHGPKPDEVRFRSKRWKEKRNQCVLPGSADVSEESARLTGPATERTQSTPKRGNSLDLARGDPHPARQPRTPRNLSEVSINGLRSSSPTAYSYASRRRLYIMRRVFLRYTLCTRRRMSSKLVSSARRSAREVPRDTREGEEGGEGLRREKICPLVARASVQ